MQDTQFVEPSVPGILAEYPLVGSPAAVTALGPGELGFSGARLWRVEARRSVYCLRRWPPEHPGRTRLTFVHQVLRFAADRGLAMLPVPLPTRTGKTFLERDGHLWELTRWLPGRADFSQNPSPARLAAAMIALANFHQAVAEFLPPRVAPSPGLAKRLVLAEELASWRLDSLARAVRSGDWPQLAELARRFTQAAIPLLAPLVARLQRARSLAVPLQPCIRDIWHDHMLFSGDQVSGIIDFGAMRIDTVACDIARLRGSLVGDSPPQQTAAMAAYESVRPLSAAECELITAFDRSTVLLGGLNWLQWVYVEKRVFEDRQRVEQRLAALLERALFARAMGSHN